jgi:ribose transport system permease protein
MAQQTPQAIEAPIGPAGPVKVRRERSVSGEALRWASRNARILAPLVTFIALFVFFSVMTDTFLSVANLRNVVTQIGAIAVAATGITFVLLCAEIDLSIASVATYAGMVTAFLATGGAVSLVFGSFTVDASLWVLVLIAVAVAALLGLVNGAMVSYVGIPSFMMTLAMLSIAFGLSRYTNAGQAIYEVPASLKNVVAVKNLFLGVPVIGWIALGSLAIGEIILSYTRFGRYVYMTGGNREAAEMSGVNTRRVVMLCLMISGLTAGIAGVLAYARLGSANPNANQDLLINTIAAVVLGGTSLFGGQGGMKNTLLGLLIYGILSNGLNLLPNLDHNLKDFLQGVILVGALLLNVFALRLERVRTRTE